ncbi:MAG TPA: hypothetical protein V6C97_32885 [Oculatellaceae cyanobacterium]
MSRKLQPHAAAEPLAQRIMPFAGIKAGALRRSIATRVLTNSATPVPSIAVGFQRRGMVVNARNIRWGVRSSADFNLLAAETAHRAVVIMPISLALGRINNSLASAGCSSYGFDGGMRGRELVACRWRREGKMART